MSDGTVTLLNHILSILEKLLPGWAVACVLACFCIVAAWAALAHRRGPTITVTVDNHRIESDAKPSHAALPKGPVAAQTSSHTRVQTVAGRWREELSRIARLEGDDDAELWIS
jgi:hypothetical protein